MRWLCRREASIRVEADGDECPGLSEIWSKKRQGLRAQPAELPSSLSSRGRFDVQATSIQVLDDVNEKKQ
jgi:hypothetical protein